MKVDPGAGVIFTLMKSDRTVVPPVTADRSPPASRMTGADSPVIAEFVDGGHAFHDVAVARNDLAGLDEHDIAQAEIKRVHPFNEAVEVLGIDVAPGVRVAARAAQGVGLRLAPPFGDGFGEIRKQHREPEPGGDLARERRCAVVGQRDPE